MKGINRTFSAGIIASLAVLTPTLATAAGNSNTTNTGFHALSSLDQTELLTLGPMSENELESIQGEFFNFGINFAFAPQINICLFCYGVSQSNVAMIFGINSFP